jgi:hypothetical protein
LISGQKTEACCFRDGREFNGLMSARQLEIVGAGVQQYDWILLI